MHNYIILIPVYNDWQSLNFLLKNIDKEISKKLRKADILIIDDCSTEKININRSDLKNIKKIIVISLKRNVGSQSGIAIGLKYLLKHQNKSVITILDSDGEDDPSQINNMIDAAEKNENLIITSNRTTREENRIFKILYFFHKLFVFIFSGFWIGFGNFNSFNSKNLNIILKNNFVWLAISSAIALNCNILKLYAKRKRRYYGKSKVNFVNLILHSLRVISVLQKRVIILSTIYFLTFYYLSSQIMINKFTILFITFLLILNLLIFAVKFFIRKDKLELWVDHINKINIY